MYVNYYDMNSDNVRIYNSTEVCKDIFNNAVPKLHIKCF